MRSDSVEINRRKMKQSPPLVCVRVVLIPPRLRRVCVCVCVYEWNRGSCGGARGGVQGKNRGQAGVCRLGKTHRSQGRARPPPVQAVGPCGREKGAARRFIAQVSSKNGVVVVFPNPSEKRKKKSERGVVCAALPRRHGHPVCPWRRGPRALVPFRRKRKDKK